MKAMIYLDTNIFVYPHTGDDTKSSACVKILERAMSEEIKAGTSIITWDEFQHALKKKFHDRKKAVELSKDFLSMPNIKFFEANKEIIEKAQKLTEEYGINPRDAIHAATAIINGIKEIISDDPDFDKVKEIKRISP